jgi:hypothetical protein
MQLYSDQLADFGTEELIGGSNGRLRMANTPGDSEGCGSKIRRISSGELIR